MNKDTLLNAIRATQMLTLLRPLEVASKASKAGLSQLRSRIEQYVAYGVTTKNIEAINYVEAISKQILNSKLITGDHCFCSKKLLDAGLSGAENISLYTLKNDNFKSLIGIRNLTEVFIKDLLEILPSTMLRTTATQPAINSVIHNFSSVCRNMDWSLTLVRLGITGKDIDAYGKLLATKHGSLQGLSALESKLTLLTTSGEILKKASKKTDSKSILIEDHMFSNHVCLSQEALIANPVIAKLMQAAAFLPKDFVDPVSIGEMLEKVILPMVVSANETPARVAQKRLDQFVKDLNSRNAGIKKIIDKKKLGNAALKRDNALKALRGIDAPLLKLLKEHPELLKQA